jgi:signal transduction histidine kinase
MEMQALASRLRSPEDRGPLEDIIRDAGNCLRETRRSVAGLRSPRQGNPRSGLSASIAQAAQQITEAKDIRLKLKLDGEPQSLPADVEYNLLRIAQEAVSNSVKHSGARMVEVTLDCTPDVVRLSVKDDGSGFSKDGNGTALPGHYGLIGMKERATQIGADLQLASEPGRGTTVSVVLPADRAVQNTR